jgi:hypothetical protein
MDKFKSFGVHPVVLLKHKRCWLKNEYCSKSRCLECNIGIELMNQFFIGFISTNNNFVLCCGIINNTMAQSVPRIIKLKYFFEKWIPCFISFSG